MRPRPTGRPWRPVLAVVVVSLLALSACSSGSGRPAASPSPARSSSGSASPSSSSSAAANRPGGTLRIVGTRDVSGDPGWAVTSAERQFVRMTARQLYAYPEPATQAAASAQPTPASAGGESAASTPVPDLAAGAPVSSDGGRTWSVQLRDVRWNVSIQRRVTASDVARGIRRLCLPPRPSPMAPWFSNMIEGYAAFCAGLRATVGGGRQQAYIETHPLAGITVVGDDKLVFRLVQPANDITSLLALPAASAVPAEELTVAPNSTAFRRALLSDGPYQPTAAKPGEDVRLSRNPAWQGSSDPVRDAWVDHVSFRFGLTAAAVQEELQDGRADMSWDTAVPDRAAAALRAAHDARLADDAAPDEVMLAAGLHGPSGALGSTAVRQALARCVDRTAAAAALGAYAQPSTTLVPAALSGSPPAVVTPAPTAATSSTASPTTASPSPGSPTTGTSTAGASPSAGATTAAGTTPDAAGCRSALAAARPGPFPTLVLLQRDSASDAAVAATVVASFARAGITVTVRKVGAAAYAREISPAGSQTWDLALARTTPEWWGGGSRSVLQPLAGLWYGRRPVDGGYRSAVVANGIAAALAATDRTRAAQLWAAVQQQIISDAALLPLATVTNPVMHGSNVRGWVAVPPLRSGDPTNVSLAAT